MGSLSGASQTCLLPVITIQSPLSDHPVPASAVPLADNDSHTSLPAHGAHLLAASQADIASPLTMLSAASAAVAAMVAAC